MRVIASQRASMNDAIVSVSVSVRVSVIIRFGVKRG